MIKAHLRNLGAQSCVAQQDDVGYCKIMRKQAVYSTRDWDLGRVSLFPFVCGIKPKQAFSLLYFAHKNRDNAGNMRRESELFQPLEKTVQL